MNIRLETKDDYRQVEELTREAFWNLYMPGCNEHYLCHILRGHKDFISELDYFLFCRDYRKKCYCDTEENRKKTENDITPP